MAEKISVEIALEGGDEIDRQLADTAEAGKKMFGDLQSSADQLDFSSVSDQFKTVATAIDTAQTAVKSAAGFESIIQGAKNVEASFEALGVAATKMGARMTRSLGLVGVALRALGPVGIAIGAVGGALLKFGNDAAESINELNASAAKLGIGFQRFDALSRGLQQAGISSAAASEGFEQLKNAGFDVAKALPQIIEQLQAMPDGVNRTNQAIALLGDKLGVEVVAALRTGSLAANQFNATMSKTTEEQRNNAAIYQQSLNKMSAAWNEFKADVAVPVAIPFFNTVKSGLDQIREGIAATKEEYVRFAMAVTPKVGIDISLTGSLQSQLDAALKKLDEIKQKGVQAAQEPTIMFNSLGQALRMVGGQGEAAGTKTKDGAVAAGQAAQQGVQIWTEWGTAASQAGDTATAGVNKATQAAQQPIPTTSWTTWANSAATAVDTLMAKLRQLLGLSQQVAPVAGGAPVGGPGGGIGSKARGGLLGGRGTGTSDSNLAWVSRGEHIMPARVVQQPGVLGLLEALRRGGGIPGFAKGGMLGTGLLEQVRWGADEALNEMVEDTRVIFDQITTLIEDARFRIRGATGGFARGGLLGGRGTGTSDSNLAWVSRGEHIMPARVVQQPGVLGLLEALRRSGRIPGFAEGGSVGGQASSLIIAPVLGRLAKQLMDIANSINSIMAPYMQSVDAFVRTTVGMDKSMAGVQESTRKVADELVAMENAIGVKGGNARGGLLGGRGTGTSDSNLAWVSRGEYVTPARAVAQPGVLAFLEALRRSGGNLSRVLDGMGQFALGGLVPRMPAMAFAGGGAVGGNLGTLHLALPSGSSVSVRASASVVEQLHREAALAQVRSGGRKPSRYS